MTILEKIKFEEDWLSEVNLTKENVKIAFAGIRATALEQEPTVDTRQRERQLEMEYQHGYDKGWEEGRKAFESQRWIPKNATNGDMIISLYPNLKYYVKGDRMMTTIGVASSFDLDWWNAPYREEDAE